MSGLRKPETRYIIPSNQKKRVTINIKVSECEREQLDAWNEEHDILTRTELCYRAIEKYTGIPIRRSVLLKNAGND